MNDPIKRPAQTSHNIAKPFALNAATGFMVAILSSQKCIMLHLDTDEILSGNSKAVKFLRDVERETKCHLHHVMSFRCRLGRGKLFKS